MYVPYGLHFFFSHMGGKLLLIRVFSSFFHFETKWGLYTLKCTYYAISISYSNEMKKKKKKSSEKNY